jgi:hypothetical protein
MTALKYLFHYPGRVGPISSVIGSGFYGLRTLLTDDMAMKAVASLGVICGIFVTILSGLLLMIKIYKEVK